jgi:deoxycytidine triphosphate deaminase
MGIYSGKQIQELIDSGTISIEPSPRIGTASIDLTLESLFSRNATPVSNQHPSENETFEEFIHKECEERKFNDGALLENRRIHVAYSRERVRIPNTIQRTVTGRSSVARLFLSIDSDVDLDQGRSWGSFEGRIPMIVNSFGPGVRIYPGQSYSQLFLRTGSHLMYDALYEVLKSGEVRLTYEQKALDPLYQMDYNNSRIILHLNPIIDVVTGQGYFDAKEPSDEMFTRIDLSRFPKGMYFDKGVCFLASTMEKVELSENYAGELQMFYRPRPLYGMTTHPNCPFHNPGAKNSLVLECRTDTPTRLSAGMPVVGMKLWKMNEGAVHKGRYSHQTGVVRSLAHEGL